MGALFLLRALAQAWQDCKSAKANSASALDFERDVERNLCDLRDELLAGTYRPGRSICFIITHPKPREVWAAQFRDRVVHHLLYNAIAPLFLPGFIANTAACIPGRGTLYAAQRLEGDVRSITQNWSLPAFYLKCDLANFFVAINKQVLQARLHTRVAPGFWRWLTDVVLLHDPREDFELRGDPALAALVPPHKRLHNAPALTGLPIGNLSSQFFANVLLDGLDQRAKHHHKARYYGRYVDDFYVLDPSPQRLNAVLADLTAWLPEALHCRLNPTKTILQPVDRGVDFVGQVVKPWRRTTRRRTVATALQRLQATEDTFTTGNSYLGLVRQASHSHTDRVQVARLLRRMGHPVAGDLSKVYRRAT